MDTRLLKQRFGELLRICGNSLVAPTAEFGLLVGAMVVMKVLFMIVQPVYSPLLFSDICAVVYHGLSMDCTVAGYFTVVPMLASLIGVFYFHRRIATIVNVYFAVISVLIALIYVVDAALYPYWGFRIDMTPIFYFTTSPSAAAASVEMWMWIVGSLCILLIAGGLWYLLTAVWKKLALKAPFATTKRRAAASVAWTLAAGLLFVAIRGGVSVSTMNPSRAYFTKDLKLNHAALNPVFSLIYSFTHQDNFASMFRFMNNDEAEAVHASLYNTASLPGDSIALPRVSGSPDVYIIILESFSSHLLPSQGGEKIALNLDRIASEGVTFTDAYAASFRTDRALTAILSGYPAPPTTSLLKYVDKLDRMESIPRSMAGAGYRTEYYYGGDINFTNLNAYLMTAGVDKVISDKDFPVGERMSKWGVHDGPLFERVRNEIASSPSSAPTLRMIQTSSSHEPYEVPVNLSANKKVNAFMYTDRCLGEFVDWLKETGRWENSLVVITPDHFGCYPENLTLAADLHHIPIIFTGGAMEPLNPSLNPQSERTVSTELTSRPVAQTDIAATLLSLLGIDYSQYPFSNNAFDPRREPFAFMTRPDFAAYVSEDGATVLSTELGESLPEIGPADNPEALYRAKAILQSLYNDLARR